MNIPEFIHNTLITDNRVIHVLAETASGSLGYKVTLGLRLKGNVGARYEAAADLLDKAVRALRHQGQYFSRGVDITGHGAKGASGVYVYSAVLSSTGVPEGTTRRATVRQATAANTRSALLQMEKLQKVLSSIKAPPNIIERKVSRSNTGIGFDVFVTVVLENKDGIGFAHEDITDSRDVVLVVFSDFMRKKDVHGSWIWGEFTRLDVRPRLYEVVPGSNGALFFRYFARVVPR